MALAGLSTSLVAAVQASLSILVVFSTGILAARLGMLDESSSRAISKVSVRLFLPALLITRIGAELHAASVTKYVVVLLWALACHAVSFALIEGLRWLVNAKITSLPNGTSTTTKTTPQRIPDWTTVAVVFNNTSSYPLMMLGALAGTGLLEPLAGDKGVDATVNRAGSFFLVYATVSSCLTFAVGPKLIDSDDKDEDEDEDNQEPDDETSLLPPVGRPLQRTRVASHRLWSRLPRPLRLILDFLAAFANAPLVGALLGTVIGLIPPLKRAFFAKSSDGGFFKAWLTGALEIMGGVFVTLPVVVAGVVLFHSLTGGHSGSRESGSGKWKLPWLPVTLTLVIRFVFWPVVATFVVYLLATRTDLVGDDPVLWFVLMMAPSGPPAIKLLAMVLVTDSRHGDDGESEGHGGDGAGDDASKDDESEDERSIAKVLAVSYLVSPVLSFAVVAALEASRAARRT